jgi:hypothetical protein
MELKNRFDFLRKSINDFYFKLEDIRFQPVQNYFKNTENNEYLQEILRDSYTQEKTSLVKNLFNTCRQLSIESLAYQEKFLDERRQRQSDEDIFSSRNILKVSKLSNIQNFIYNTYPKRKATLNI